MHKRGMHLTGEAILRAWHKSLGLSRQSPPSWYRDRIREELQERRNAKTHWQKLSETADVLFSMSRARFDGYSLRTPPRVLSRQFIWAYVYMLAKYTLRWQFYRLAATLCRAPNNDKIREVVNPGKDSKLAEVATRHDIDPLKFVYVASRLRRIWPLLP